MSSASTQIDRYISPAAQAAMREIIAEYGGVEVFFVGRVGENSIVEEAEPLAFGNQDAVPVIERLVSPGNVVLHNHPSGGLEPSQEDVALAARFGTSGVGSYIIDNAVKLIRVIVPAMEPHKRVSLSPVKLEALLAPNGPLARAMNQYEERPQQLRMLRTVADAFNDEGIAVIEAGTGTGKSLAYLLPAISWAVSNGEKVIVSTNTINLQEQLITKDLPFLRRHLNIEFKAELMKGRNNYLCKRRAGFLKASPDFFADESQAAQIQDILEWAAKTQEGSLSSLGFIPDFETWEQVYCDPDNCMRFKCAHYAECFFYQARRRAAAADIVVANHHLVMADLAIRAQSNNYTSTAVLPAYKRIIFDEAHNLEDAATQYFGICITRSSLARPLARLVHRQRSHVGLLPFLRDRLVLLDYKSPSPDVATAVRVIEERLIPLRRSLAQSFKDLMDLCAKGVCEHTREPLRAGREQQMRVTPRVEEQAFWSRALRDALREATTQMQDLAAGLKEIRGTLGKLPEEQREEFENAAGELKSLASRLASRADEFLNFYTIGENRCRWIEARQSKAAGSGPVVRLWSLPLEIQDELNQAVYARASTIIMTSATLSVNRRFDFFLSQVGLDETHSGPSARERLITLHLETPFDYERQAFVGVPLDMPEPRAPGFTDAATSFLLPILQITRGSAFVLFTSYHQMDAFYDKMAPLLQSLGHNCLKQGTDNRQSLLQRFKNDRFAVLFATSSFWEGVDVPGDALRLLVLVKLPFRVPSDPLVQARAERLEALGADSFTEYSVPQAVIKFKQGFGRLIRTREDTGAVLILDRRVATKPYGQIFLNSLPSGTIHGKPADDLVEDLRAFFLRRPRRTPE